MDRRGFIETCTAGAACASAGAPWPVFAADARPKPYSRVLLVDELGDPLRVAKLQPLVNYVFQYPYVATPVFLLDLGKAAPPQVMSLRNNQTYGWPGGVGRGRSVVAFSAICAHKLVYPTRDVSFISFRRTRARRGVQDRLIHCCAENSQYDPAKGAEVLSGPAPQPLCAVLLDYDPRADTLAAWATLGGELFDEFFSKYDAKLSLDVGPRARDVVTGQAVVRELEKYCRNPVQC
ncbi:twin-arginine translocation signal domain-containing protein [Caenimonas terrae]|uniref:Twin-arginine translocation signal domain-containing protein n=1 Tax=Caenimonas terrae TaxID=696074 RepID=A0ABW0NHW4_9BURK